MDTATAPSPSDFNEDSFLCAGCGYRLFGIDSERCPECGLIIDRTILGQSQIPWAHRKTIGRWRAFWRTVFRVNFRPGKIGVEANRPVSFSDAQKFRHICIAMAWVPLMVWAVIGICSIDQAATWEKIAAGIVIGAALWLFLLAITGIPSYFFHPRSMPILRQNRAIALSYYSSAALAWIPVVAVVPIALFFVRMDNTPQWEFRWIVLPIIVLCFGAIPVLGIMQWSAALALLKHSTQCASGRRWAMGLSLPVGWILSAAIFLVGILALALFVAIVLVSTSI